MIAIAGKPDARISPVSTAAIDPTSSAPAPAAAAPPAANPLLTAPIFGTLLRFALPNMVAMLATALAAIAETSYVGSFGVASLGGMALVFPVVMLQTMLSGGAMGGGISSAVSRALGANDAARANALAVHAMWIGITAGTVYMAFMLALGPAFFALLGGRDEALAQAVAYSNVAFVGSIGVWLMNTFASVVRGAGNMKVPSITFFTVSVAQVLVGGAFGLGWGPFPRLGMPGVALGQVVAYAAGAVFLFFYLRSAASRVKLSVRGTPLRRDLFHDILKVGGFACISPFQTVLTILIVTRLVAHFGTTALAGYGIGTRLEFLLIPIAFAFGVASVPMVGMAIGAGKVARARRVAWTAGAMAGVTLGLLGLLMAVMPDLWTRLFTHDQQVVDSAALYFHWAGPCYGLFGLGLCLYFSSLAAGKVAGPVMAGTLRLVLVAVGGWLLARAQAPSWTIFALVAAGLAAYGFASVAAIRYTHWGTDR
jgi:putative MATE family efflux protein